MGSRLGFVNVFLVAIIIVLGIFLTGVFTGQKFENGSSTSLGSSYTCCDSGDGDACVPQKEKPLTLNGVEYGLLKSNFSLAEKTAHLKDSGQKDSNGDPIILNTSDGISHKPCSTSDQDQVVGPGPGFGECVAIPNDEIIYVCRQNCQATPSCPVANCYGNEKTVYDAYFRLSDFPTPGVPPVIANCTGPTGTQAQNPGAPTIVMEKQPQRENLQLQTFQIIQQTTVPWLSPWCKPAVYLYPEQTSYVSVRINSSEPLTYSDPLYPNSGWGVIAEPSGLINYQNKPYDYLYYETQVADSTVDKPNKGFVVGKDKLPAFFSDILPKLGLNIRETKQFSDYWIKVLPQSPYYFVGVIPQTTLNSLTSLNILPQPQTEIRVTLYFEPLEQKISVDEPQISTPRRTGFTVVEWGGIFKKNKNTNFSCFQ